METTTQTVWEYLEAETAHAEGVRELADWSRNYDVRTGTPFQLFLDIIGYSYSEYGTNFVSKPHEIIGYLEADYLGDALKEYANNPQAVTDWIDGLMEVELQDQPINLNPVPVTGLGLTDQISQLEYRGGVMKVPTINGKIYMCDKCNQNPMQYTVKGLTELAFYDGLCGKCCADWLRANGDSLGASKFEQA